MARFTAQDKKAIKDAKKKPSKGPRKAKDPASGGKTKETGKSSGN